VQSYLHKAFLLPWFDKHIVDKGIFCVISLPRYQGVAGAECATYSVSTGFIPGICSKCETFTADSLVVKVFFYFRSVLRGVKEEKDENLSYRIVCFDVCTYDCRAEIQAVLRSVNRGNLSGIRYPAGGQPDVNV
jgi:hypothetical protein